MALIFRKSIILMAMTIIVCRTEKNNLNVEIEAPEVLSYNSPLRKPDSLKSRPYYDFLSMLYRHDSTKSDLFRPYQRTKRSMAMKGQYEKNSKRFNKMMVKTLRKRRAIIFRPLFVYRQQQQKNQYNYQHQFR